MHDIIHADTEANRVSEAVARMRAMVLSKGPLLMKAGGNAGGIACEYLSPETKAEMVARLKADRSYTYDDAARDYKLDRRTVFTYAKQAGIRRAHPVDPGKLQAAVALARAAGLSAYAAAKRFGLPPNSVFRALHA